MYLTWKLQLTATNSFGAITYSSKQIYSWLTIPSRLIMYQGKEDTNGQEDKFRFYFMQTNVGKQISFKSFFIISRRNIFIYKYWKLETLDVNLTYNAFLTRTHKEDSFIPKARRKTKTELD